MIDTDVMTFDEAKDQVYYWHDREVTVADRERAFDDLIGWVAGRAVSDPTAADTLRRIRERAELS